MNSLKAFIIVAIVLNWMFGCKTSNNSSTSKDVVGFNTTENKIYSACLKEGKIKAYECKLVDGNFNELKCGSTFCSKQVGDVDGITIQEYLSKYPYPSGPYPKSELGLTQIQQAIQYEESRSEPKKEELAKLKQMQSALKTYLIAESKLSQESVESHPDYEQVVFVAVNILFQNQEKKMAVLRNEALRELRKKEHEEFLNERRNSCQEDYKACADLCEFKRRKAEKEECLWQCNYDRIPCLAKWSS